MIQPELAKALEIILNQASNLEPNRKNWRTIGEAVNNLASSLNSLHPDVVSFGSYIVAAMFDSNCYTELMAKSREIYNQLTK